MTINTDRQYELLQDIFIAISKVQEEHKLSDREMANLLYLAFRDYAKREK